MTQSKTLTKADIIEHLIELSTHQCSKVLDKKTAAEILESMLETMTEELANGNTIKIPGLGNFTLRDKKARIGRNPKTKEEFPISARRVVSFRTSAKFKNELRKKEK